MGQLNQYIPKIVESLKSVDPYKIYLFGSVANGSDDIDIDSDIDLAVILNKDDIPSTYQERLDNKVYVRSAILELSMEVPIDILVYTKKEFALLTSINNPFLSEVIDKGSIIYG